MSFSPRQAGLTVLLVATAAVAVLLAAALPGAGPRPGTPPAGPATGPVTGPVGAVVDLEEAARSFAGSLSKRHDYSPPTPAQREAFGAAVGRMLDGAFTAEDFAPFGYTATRRVDAATGREFVEVAEPVPTGRGWGVIYLDTSAPVHHVIQVPHPLADLDTETIAVDLFRRLPGTALLIAGTHRKAGTEGAGDAAHRTDHMFHTAAGEFTRRRVPAVQIHGFHDDTVPDTDVVISTGPAPPGPPATTAADSLQAAGLRVCRVWTRTDRACDRLEALTNAQGRVAAGAGLPFLHVECSRTLRADPETRRTTGTALAAALTPATT